MVDISDFIDFCFLHAPKGFAQDSNDQEQAKREAACGEIQSLLFSYGGYNTVFIRLPPVTIELKFELCDEKLDVSLFLDFVNKIRRYVIEHSS